MNKRLWSFADGTVDCLGRCVLEEVIFELSRTLSGKKVEDKRSRHLIFIRLFL